MRGNSLNIADTTPFTGGEHSAIPPHELLDWWDSCGRSHRARITRALHEAQSQLTLREEGRRLTVLLVSLLRSRLVSYTGISEAIIYFATLDELLLRSITSAELKVRQRHFDANVLPALPGVIASVPPERHLSIVGVSPGKAEGVLAIPGTTSDTHVIILTERLTPELAPLLGRPEHHIVGIISAEGGLLSHMAIVARERGVPVVVDPHALTKYTLGDRVTIDGSQGVIFVHET
jgi:phosphohistidine swiveling domain-containing protein